MNREELIHRFCDRVNRELANGDGSGTVVYDELAPQAGDQQSVLDQLSATYHEATRPTRFFNQRALEVDSRFEQCYELMRLVFDESELEPRERYVAFINALGDEHNPSPLVMVGRFWSVSGPQMYAESGQLSRFAFDPLTVTDSIAGVISGNYMSLQSLHGQREGIGAIGHAATRSFLRRGQGHGTILLEAFEEEARAVAARRGERLRLIILEAQGESLGFWSKRGFRWPVGTNYAQPPLEFDPLTGEPLHAEVPEVLMVKSVDDPAASHLDTRLLMDAVEIMYRNWCLIGTTSYPERAARRAEDYVFGKVFAQFVASLPAGEDSIRLGDPPAR